MPITATDLANLALQFESVLLGPAQLEHGQPFTVSVLPATSQLSFIDTVGATVLWLAKDVTFTNPDLVTADLTISEINSLAGSALSPVPGVVGQAAAALPIAVPIYVFVDWKILENGSELRLNEDFLAPNGITSPEAVFVIASPVGEPTDVDPEPLSRSYKISVRVRLHGGGESYSRTLPDIEVEVPTIPLLTFLALFRHDQFYQPDLWGNAILIATPFGVVYPQDVPDVLARLDGLRAIVGRLSSFVRFALFLAQLDELARLIRITQPKRPAVKTRPAGSDNCIHDLSTTILFKHAKKKFRAENCFSSLILIGVPNRKIALFNKKKCDPEDGQLDLTLDKSLFISIPSLHFAYPAGTPVGTVSVAKESSEGGKTFGNTISSIKFTTA